LNILITALQPVGGIRTYFRYIFSHQQFSGYTFTFIAPDEDLRDFLKQFIPDDRYKYLPVSGNLDFGDPIQKKQTCRQNNELIVQYPTAQMMLI